MSRTIRRKDEPKPRWGLEECVYENGHSQWIPYQGKELIKILARHHSDVGYNYRSTPGKWFRQNHEGKFRARNRTKLARFNENPEYVVIMDRKMKLPYWD